LKISRVETDQQLPLFHMLPGGVEDLRHLAVDARLQRHVLESLDTPDGLDHHRHVRRFGLADHHRHRWRRLRRGPGGRPGRLIEHSSRHRDGDHCRQQGNFLFVHPENLSENSRGPSFRPLRFKIVESHFGDCQKTLE